MSKAIAKGYKRRAEEEKSKKVTRKKMPMSISVPVLWKTWSQEETTLGKESPVRRES